MTLHILDDIESVLDFFEDDESASPLEGFAGDQLDIPMDDAFQELNWAPKDNHLILGLLEPSSSCEWMYDEAVGFGRVRHSPSNSGNESKKRDWVEKRKSRSRRVGRVWSLQSPLPLGGGGRGLPMKKCCSHCQAEKTPQWRMGPLGPKTLCNACGVRYNSGRLVPEYRPAASPTFVSHLHSNSHRKIMLMREQRKLG